LKETFGTLWVAQYQGKQALAIIAAESIHSVVGMIPFMLSDTENADKEMSTRFSSTYFVSEKPFLEFLGTVDIASEEEGAEEGGSEDADNQFM
jgi:hypothetical protein